MIMTTTLLTISICLTVVAGVWLYRRELLAFAHAAAARFLQFKARFKEIDDSVWRR
jgi:hypothetical protein